MELVEIFEGPTPFAEALQAELKLREIGCIVRGSDQWGAVMPHSTIPGAFCRVLISREDQAAHADAVNECLAFFTPAETPEEEDFSGQV